MPYYQSVKDYHSQEEAFLEMQDRRGAGESVGVVGHRVWITKHTKWCEKLAGGSVAFAALRSLRDSEARRAMAGGGVARLL